MLSPRNTLCALLLTLSLPLNAADDLRQLVELPPMMQQHMLANMRDHLQALTEIQRALAQGRFEQAADLAETRLGMTSLQSHGAQHMGQFMPEGMRTIGTAMHRAASRFAIKVEEAGAGGELPPVLDAMADIMAQCAACHNGYRVH